MAVNPGLILSLDFEMRWGRRGKIALEEHKPILENSIPVIRHTLQAFKAHQVNATWATVGAIMAADGDEACNYLPECLPTYKSPTDDPYGELETSKFSQHLDDIRFGPGLVKEILVTPGQELGSHTYSHFCTRDTGFDERSFDADLAAATKIAKDKFGVELASFVYPRNQVGLEHVVAKHGFKSIRVNKGYKRLDKSLSVKSLVARAPYLYGSFGHTDFAKQGGLLAIPGYRFLGITGEAPRWKEELRFRQVLAQMRYAAKLGRFFHLWWHPEDLGRRPDHSLSIISRLASTAGELAKSGYPSYSMGDLLAA